MTNIEAIQIVLKRIEHLKEAIIKESDVSRQKFLRLTLKNNEDFLRLLTGNEKD